ncbi:hypothetical protein HGRIS_006465 [Hohenbuehelia grisea]|uniref:non-specific serine/threonine protein kinase n=1 Tax=Hohenbuehelia grisea TaxID=104357 RepID=A0ABR3K336_9AGAR
MGILFNPTHPLLFLTMALATIGRWVSESLRARRQPWALLNFSTNAFQRISADVPIEEETLPDYVAARYYPIRIGELLASRYQVVGKLGYGTTSTVWLARDLTERRHVAVKVYVDSNSMGSQVSKELSVYERLNKGPVYHPGRQSIRTLLDSFTLTSDRGLHHCLVHPPLWESVLALLLRNPEHRLPTPILTIVLYHVFQALDYAKECKIIHTDIKASNIMFGIKNPAVFDKFEQEELENPSPRKDIDGGRVIYTSRQFTVPSHDLGPPILCDFGSAVFGDEEHSEDAQPDVYRSPEVIFSSPWSYEIDIWNVGCMIWDIYEGLYLFNGIDPERGFYRSRAHLVELIAVMGLPPREVIARGSRGSEFFSESGEYHAGLPIPPSISFEELETRLRGEDKELFLKMVRKMLQWDARQRATAKELLEDEWLVKHMVGNK